MTWPCGLFGFADLAGRPYDAFLHEKALAFCRDRILSVLIGHRLAWPFISPIAAEHLVRCCPILTLLHPLPHPPLLHSPTHVCITPCPTTLPLPLPLPLQEKFETARQLQQAYNTGALLSFNMIHHKFQAGVYPTAVHLIQDIRECVPSFDNIARAARARVCASMSVCNLLVVLVLIVVVSGCALRSGVHVHVCMCACVYVCMCAICSLFQGCCRMFQADHSFMELVLELEIVLDRCLEGAPPVRDATSAPLGLDIGVGTSIRRHKHKRVR